MSSVFATGDTLFFFSLSLSVFLLSFFLFIYLYTGSSREIETTVFDLASQFLSNISRLVYSFFTHISRRTSKFQSAVSICQFLFPGMTLYVHVYTYVYIYTLFCITKEVVFVKYLSIYQFIILVYLSIYLYICLSMSICLSIYLFIYLFIYLSKYLSICLSI